MLLQSAKFSPAMENSTLDDNQAKHVDVAMYLCIMEWVRISVRICCPLPEPPLFVFL